MGLRITPADGARPHTLEETGVPVWLFWRLWVKDWGVAVMGKAFGLSPYLISEGLEFAAANQEVMDQEERNDVDAEMKVKEAEARLGPALRAM